MILRLSLRILVQVQIKKEKMHVNSVKGMTLKKMSGLEIIRIFEKNMKMSDLANKKYIKKDLKKSGVNFGPDIESCPDWEGPV